MPVDRSSLQDALGLDSIVDLSQNAPAVSGAGVLIVQRILLTPGESGEADDTTAVVPFKCRVIRTFLNISDPWGGGEVTLTDAVGGMGTALSGVFNCSSPGQVLEPGGGPTPSVTTVLAAGSSLYVHRTTDVVGGELFVLLMREA